MESSNSNWTIAYTKQAEKFLDKLQQKDRERILLKISQLLTNEKNLDIKHLSGTDGGYRLRVGNYRIIYNKHDDMFIIEVIKIGDRKDIYNK